MRVARAGDHFDFQYPQGWKYQPFEHSAMLDAGQGNIVHARFAPKMYDVADGGEVLRKLAGQLPDVLTTRLSFKSRNLGSGAVAHTWVLKIPKGESTGVVRVYAVPLSTGGAALFSGVFTEVALKRLESALEAVAATVKANSRVEADEAPANTALAPVASAKRFGVPSLTEREAEDSVREWTAKLIGSSWYSEGRTLRFKEAGRYDSPQGPEGTWRVIIWESRTHVALSTPTGQPLLIRCHGLKRVL